MHKISFQTILVRKLLNDRQMKKAIGGIEPPSSTRPGPALTDAEIIQYQVLPLVNIAMGLTPWPMYFPPKSEF